MVFEVHPVIVNMYSGQVETQRDAQVHSLYQKRRRFVKPSAKSASVDFKSGRLLAIPSPLDLNPNLIVWIWTEHVLSL